MPSQQKLLAGDEEPSILPLIRVQIQKNHEYKRTIKKSSIIEDDSYRPTVNIDLHLKNYNYDNNYKYEMRE